MPIPHVKKIIVIMLENRSFDNVLGYLYKYPEDYERMRHLPFGSIPDVTNFDGLSTGFHLDAANPDLFSNPIEVGANSKRVKAEPSVCAPNVPGYNPGEQFRHVNFQLFKNKDGPDFKTTSLAHFTDPVTHINWLKLTEMMKKEGSGPPEPLTKKELADEMIHGERLQDWRRASQPEVLQMLRNFGISTTYNPEDPDESEVEAIRRFIHLAGNLNYSKDPNENVIETHGTTTTYHEIGNREGGAQGYVSLSVNDGSPSVGAGGIPVLEDQKNPDGPDARFPAPEGPAWLLQKPKDSMQGFAIDYVKHADPGLVTEFHANLEEFMHSYTPADLPVLSALAKGYAVCDEWFSSVPTQTNANRAFSLAGTSQGLVDNGWYTWPKLDSPLLPSIFAPLFENDHINAKTIFDVFDDKSTHGKFITWRIFYHNLWPPKPVADGYPYTANLLGLSKKSVPERNLEKMEKFYRMAEEGTLPQFSYVEPAFGGAAINDWISRMGNDFHPPSDTTLAEEMLRNVYTSLRNGPDWDETLLVVLFDEHGGTYDHVEPPWGATPPWGYGPPPREATKDGTTQYDFSFNRFGVRTPAIVISPYIEPRTVFRKPLAKGTDDTVDGTPFDHTSLLATLLDHFVTTDRKQWDLGERVASAPLFNFVVTRNDAREDNVLLPQAKKSGDALSFGEPFYLRAENNLYITQAERTLREEDPGPIEERGLSTYFATLGQSPQSFSFRKAYVPPESTWHSEGTGRMPYYVAAQIRSDQVIMPILRHDQTFTSYAGIYNTLGVFGTGPRGCYYWFASDRANPTDYRNYALSQFTWEIRMVEGTGDFLYYGAKVEIKYRYSSSSVGYLVPEDTQRGRLWATDSPSANLYQWTIEPVDP